MIINNGNALTEENEMLKYIRKLSKRDPKEARTQILHYLAKNKDDVDAYYLYGQIEEQLGNLEDAINAFGIVAAQPRGVNKFNALVRIGVNKEKQGRTEEAKKYLQAAIDTSPKNEKTACITLSTIYCREKQYDKALELLREIENKTSDVMERISITLSLQGKKREALETLKKIKKGSSQVYNRHLALEKAKLAIAIEDFNQAELFIMDAKSTKTKDELYYQAMHQEAILASAKEEYSRVINLCEELLTYGQNLAGNINITMGEAQEALGNYAGAIKNYQIAANTSSDANIRSNGHYHLGILEFAMGDFASAERDLKASITNTEAANKAKTIKLVSMYLKQGRYQEAEELVNKFKRNAKDKIDEVGLGMVPLIVAKKTGRSLPKRNRSYLENQVIEYRRDEAIRHIKAQHRNQPGTRANFSKTINIDELFDEIQLQMVDANMVNEDIFDIYAIDYPNAGYDLENELVHQIRVVTIPGTKDIITMYPSKRRALKRSGQMSEKLSEQKKVGTKQIDRFNNRFAKFTATQNK